MASIYYVGTWTLWEHGLNASDREGQVLFCRLGWSEMGSGCRWLFRTEAKAALLTPDLGLDIFEVLFKLCSQIPQEAPRARLATLLDHAQVSLMHQRKQKTCADFGCFFLVLSIREGGKSVVDVFPYMVYIRGRGDMRAVPSSLIPYKELHFFASPSSLGSGALQAS